MTITTVQILTVPARAMLSLRLPNAVFDTSLRRYGRERQPVECYIYQYIISMNTSI